MCTASESETFHVTVVFQKLTTKIIFLPYCHKVSQSYILHSTVVIVMTCLRDELQLGLHDKCICQRVKKVNRHTCFARCDSCT